MDDVYIRVLKYGRDNAGFSEADIETNFPDDKAWILRKVRKDKLFSRESIANKENAYYLSFEDRFRLLEYEELNEARASSKRAMIVAIISIVITLLSVVGSFWWISDVRVVNGYDDAYLLSEVEAIAINTKRTSNELQRLSTQIENVDKRVKPEIEPNKSLQPTQ